jgi:hypothetical protein
MPSQLPRDEAGRDWLVNGVPRVATIAPILVHPMMPVFYAAKHVELAGVVARPWASAGVVASDLGTDAAARLRSVWISG